MSKRPLRQDEKNLIIHLLTLVDGGKKYQIPGDVEDLNDGGMGSIQFTRHGLYAGDIINVTYQDEDGQIVLIVLTKNEYDELYDLDIWKVDFKPLLRYPVPERVSVTS